LRKNIILAQSNLRYRLRGWLSYADNVRVHPEHENAAHFYLPLAWGVSLKEDSCVGTNKVLSN